MCVHTREKLPVGGVLCKRMVHTHRVEDSEAEPEHEHLRGTRSEGVGQSQVSSRLKWRETLCSVYGQFYREEVKGDTVFSRGGPLFGAGACGGCCIFANQELQREFIKEQSWRALRE